MAKQSQITVWEFQDFFITLIFREVNVEESRSAKSSILTHLEALNCDFYEFVHFNEDDIYKRIILKAPKIAKTAIFAILDSPKMILRKIWATEKSWNVQTMRYKQSFQNWLFSIGSLYIPGDIDEIWFWFSESSVIWSPSTPSGMFLILFSFKSMEFKRARVANDTGNSWIWFLLASISFRFLSLPEKRCKLNNFPKISIYQIVTLPFCETLK